LSRDAKYNKKGFYNYVNQKRKMNESILLPPLPRNEQELQPSINTDEETAEVLNRFLPQSSLASALSPPESMDRKLGTRGVKPLPV